MYLSILESSRLLFYVDFFNQIYTREWILEPRKKTSQIATLITWVQTSEGRVLGLLGCRYHFTFILFVKLNLENFNSHVLDRTKKELRE